MVGWEGRVKKKSFSGGLFYASRTVGKRAWELGRNVSLLGMRAVEKKLSTHVRRESIKSMYRRGTHALYITFCVCNMRARHASWKKARVLLGKKE